ncbi:Hypothetical protein ZAZAV_67 [Cedratvirus Zaza IHUMI]|uniref:Uncharacterized protein n=1 Tax=Cedratvirus Zaza IHUMI TaxID=2126979 RepID=A0A2R8FDD1_9VIRU|nr:Hypothetical protein ZAZAV_67 [Cedratvirus Zaza IHUMI]
MQSEPVITTLEPLPPICKEDGFISSQRRAYWDFEPYIWERDEVPFPALYEMDEVDEVVGINHDIFSKL